MTFRHVGCYQQHNSHGYNYLPNIDNNLKQFNYPKDRLNERDRFTIVNHHKRSNDSSKFSEAYKKRVVLRKQRNALRLGYLEMH